MRKHARSPALPPLQCALRPALLCSHVLRRQGHTDTKFQFCEASRYDLRECFGNRTRSRERMCFGNIARSREKSCATGWRTNSNRRVFGHMTVRRSAGICDLKNQNHTLWGSPARLSYASGAKSRDMGCSYARGTTRRRDMPDVVAPYVIGTILTVGNTGGANTDPRYAGGATRVRNRLLVKNSYARRFLPFSPRKVERRPLPWKGVLG